MMKTETFFCENSSIEKAVHFVRDYFDEQKIGSKVYAMPLLKLENALVAIIGKAKGDRATFRVTIIRHLSRIWILIRCAGEPVNVQEIVPDMGVERLDEETRNVINSRLLPVLSENIKTRNRYGINRVTIGVNNKKMNKLVFNTLCMLVGILMGLLVKTCLPANVSGFFANEILGTIMTAFFNVLKMIVAPLVFFSIMTGLSGFGDAGGLGRISVKALAYFVGFSILGLLIGVGIFSLFPVGSPEMMKMMPQNAGTAAAATVSAWDSFKSLILSIFPSNLLGAFVNNEILAVIFLAVIMGICTMKMQSDFAEKLRHSATVLNDLMCNLATMIVSVMPFIIFCSMAKMIITVEFSSVLLLLKLLGIFFLGVLILFGIFAIVLAVNGISPVTFFKGFAPAILSAFTLASSSATIPISLKCCTENLKIPTMISYFVIPLGSTINMNGSCILLTMVCMFTARVFGVQLTLSMMIPLLCMILLLSMAAPGVPGSLLIMMASLMPMMGIPPEAAQLTICISTFIGMIMVPANSTGDAVVTMLIHNGELKKAKK